MSEGGLVDGVDNREERIADLQFIVDLQLSDTEFGLKRHTFSAGNARITVCFREAINFALVHNGVGPLAGIGIINTDSARPLTVDQMRASLASLEAEADRSESSVSQYSWTGDGREVDPDSFLVMDQTELAWSLPAESFINIDEASADELRLQFSIDGHDVHQTIPIRRLAHDEWNATTVPELLAAFVRPRADAVQDILSNAADILQKTTGDPSLVGYQRGEARVRATARAIYEALQSAGIRYSEPPASFEATGQRIRTHDDVLMRKFGTCIDLSLLYAACLEEAGLNPVVAICPGHALAGLFLDDAAPKRFVVSTPEQLSNLFGGDLMLAVETVGFTFGAERDFDDAVREAHRKADGGRGIRYVLDIRAAHRRVRPLPKISTVDGTRIIETVSVAVSRRVPGAPGAVTRSEPAAIDRAPARVQGWMGNLLDLTRRNPLLNLSSRRGVEVLVPSVQLGDLEDYIQSHGVVRLRTADDLSDLQRSRGWSSVRQVPEEELFQVFDQENALFVHNEGGSAANKLIRMRREARAAVEETGSNSLFLTIGTFQWVDSAGGVGGTAPLYLLPVVLAGSKSSAFEVSLDPGQEIVPNNCLIEKLKQEHGVEFDVLENPHKDSSGIDIQRILAELRDEFVRKGLEFSVNEQVYLANLQFSTIDLWRDIKNNWEKLAEKPLVSHLVNSTGEVFADSVDAPEVVATDEVDACLPLPADSSQLAAIKAATAGCSFVLEGPPGTGKSQTITNMIVDGIASGRSILFVAEKQAALEVVEERLKRAGVGSLVLNVHGAKQSAAPVRKQLAESLDDHRVPNPAAFEVLTSQLRDDIETLTRYPHALHDSSENGTSVWSLYQHWAQLDSSRSATDEWTPEDLGLTSGTVNSYGDELLELASRSHRLSRRNVVPRSSPEWDVLVQGIASDDSALSPGVLEDLLDAVGRLLEAFDHVREPVATALDLLHDRRELFVEWLEGLPAQRSAIPSQLQSPDPSPESLHSIKREAGELSTRWSSFAAKLTPAAYHLDLSKLRADYRSAQDANIFKRHRLLKNSTDEILTIVQPVCADEYKDEPLRLLNDVEALHAETRQLSDKVKSVLGSKNFDPFADATFHWLDHEIHLASETLRQRNLLRRLIADRPRAADALEQLVVSDLDATLRGDHLAEVEQLYRAWDEVCSSACLTSTSSKAWMDGRSPIEIIRKNREGWNLSLSPENRTSAVEGLEFLVVLERLRTIGVPVVADELARGTSAAGLEDAMAIATARVLLDDALRRSGLASTDKHEYLDDVEKYLKSSRQLKKGLVREVPAQLIEASSRQKSINSRLRKEIDRSRGGSVRQMFERFGEQILQVTPCVLMSPASVARFLSVGAANFDTVIFDEASQIRVADAVGALGRAAAAVVVGDSKQMPPGSSFAATQDDESEFDGEMAVGDQESILSEAVASGMNQRWLSWHYRSRDDSLIEFSNRRYYRNRLSVFPSPPGRRSGMGVESVFVGGQFGHGAERTNPKECEVIVQEVRHRLARDPSASLGIITFNVQQRDLILDQLENCQDEAVRKALTSSRDPLFVKNLDNVQGDERDHIFFSLAFSPRADDGRMPMNFGPLNNVGGERRLNVAVTRARESVTLYTSIKSSELDLKRTRALGVAHLKEYLAFAEGRTRTESAVHQERYDLYRDSVRDALVERGLEVVTDVGVSSFRVDLAVRASPSHGWLAVVLDTPEWAERIAVSDRVALPSQILEGVMGWQGTYQMLLPVWHADPMATVADVERCAQALSQPEPSVDATREPVDVETDGTQVQSMEETVSPRKDDFSSLVESFHSDEDLTSLGHEESSESLLVRSAGEVHAPNAQNIPSKAEDFGGQHEYREYPEKSIGNREELDQLKDAAVREKVSQHLSDIINVEGPIEESRLAKILGSGFGFGRITGGRSRDILALARETPERLDGFGTFYWPESINPELYSGYRPRGDAGNYEAREISPREVANAMTSVLQQRVENAESAPTREELIREAANLFNFNRVGARIRDHFGRVIDWKLSAGSFQLTDTNHVILG